jgi:hypothetical protein
MIARAGQKREDSHKWRARKRTVKEEQLRLDRQNGIAGRDS